MEPLTIAEPSPNHPRDAPVPDASDDAAIIAEITAFEEAKAHRRSPAFLCEQINSISFTAALHSTCALAG
jgi:hypothetical protein